MSSPAARSLALVLVFANAACTRVGANAGKPCAPSGDRARIALATLPNTLDWSKSHEASYVNYPVMHALMRGLTRLDEKNEPVPSLAERWEMELTSDTPPKQIYTFHLRPGITWSDGKTPLVAEDFAFAWRRVARVGNEIAELLDLEGADAVLAARNATGPDAPAKLDAAVKGLGVEAVDTSTFRVTLRSPRSYFLARIAYVYPFFPAPSTLLATRSEEEIRRYYDEPADGAPYTVGAFTVKTWDRVAQVIRLVPNPHDPDPPAGGVAGELMLVEAELAPMLYDQCKIDFLFMDDPSTLASAGAELQRTPLLSIYYLGMNTSKVPIELRRAIAAALDRPKLTERLLPAARTAYTFLPPDMPGAVAPDDPRAAEYPRYDPARAKELLAKTSYHGEELTLIVRASSTFMPELGIADAVRRQLGELGIVVRVVTSSDFTNDIKTADGTLRHHLFLKRIGADYAHPQTLFTPFLPNGNHYTDWQKLDGGRAIAEFQHLLDAGAAETDAEKMRSIYAEAQAMILEKETVIVPIYFPDRYYRRRPWIHGLGVNGFNFLSLGAVTVKTAAVGP